MLKKHIGFVAAAALSLFAFVSCGVMADNNVNDGYGSLVINKESSRSLDVSSIKKAKITITGNGIDSEVSQTVSVTGGKASNIVIEKIPAGANRIVTVQGLDASDNNIADALIRAVTDIEAKKENSCDVNWSTSRKGYIYNALYEADVNVKDLSAEKMAAIAASTPDCDATSINLSLFVSDFKADSLGDKSKYIIDSSLVLKRLTVSEAVSSTAEAPVLSATAYFSDGNSKDVTSTAEWTSSVTSVATVAGGKITLKKAGETVVTGSYTYNGVKKTGAEQTVKVTNGGDLSDKTIIFVKASSQPCIWVWEDGGVAISDEGMGLTWNSESSNPGLSKMPAATTEYMSNPDGWYMYDVTAYVTAGNTKVIKFILNWNGSNTVIGKACTFWYDGSSCSTTNPSPVAAGLSATITAGEVPDPQAPTVTCSAKDGDEISLKGSITFTVTSKNCALESGTAKVNGKSFTLNVGTTTVTLAEAGVTTADKTFKVSASVKNSEGSAAVEEISVKSVDVTIDTDTFTWDNVNCYFVLQDRFYNGDTNNDNCYGRVNQGVPQYATFHGGDIPGLTAKMDYFKKLGVNAIWITAPYEQMHGWTSGAGDAFPHYGFHGYYTLDWTFMDQNMGTVEEFRTFVQKCHENGIRVVMDVVMNHTGYEDWQDMIDYGFGAFKDATLSNPGKYNHACFATNGKYAKGGDGWGTDWGSDNFSKWWSSWCRGFDGKFGFATPGGDDLTKCLDGLPDVVQEKSGNATIPAFLQTKWNSEVNNTTSKSYGNKTSHSYADYQNPSVANVDWYGKSGNWRESNKGAVVDYQVIWLSAWVRELGIDGFRCDTQKHVQEQYWKKLQQACQSALEAWRKDNTKVDNSGAKNWDENFWMTGECCPRGADNTGAPYIEGYFDSMINFRDSSTSGHSSGSMIKEEEWSSYMKINNNPIDSNNNGNRNNLLTYVSSHDTNICRQGGVKLGTMLQLLPGGIQVFYGDESDRPTYSGASDDMVSRSDMNWSDISGSKKDMVEHWGKVGNFRKYNPAVGAGSGTAYKRTYSESNAGGENKVAISISGTSVDVSGLFSDGTTVYNWYDGSSATVSGGKVTFNGGSVEKPILVSDRNPADYCVE